MYWVVDFERYGVVEFDENFNVLFIEEKLSKFKFNYVVFGLYFYDNIVVEVVKNFKLSVRGEYEIIDVNKYYLVEKKLKVGVLGRGVVWLDMGMYKFLM